MDINVVERLKALGLSYTQREIENATQYELEGGEKVNVYHRTGTISVQGKNTELKVQLQEEFKGKKGLATRASKAPSASQVVPPEDVDLNRASTVFVVYGHDVEAREGLELLLHKMGLKPVVLANLPSRGATIIEKLEECLLGDDAPHYACVLLTPDDEGYPQGAEEQKRYRARQNVILELGMVLAKLGRKNVAILHKGTVEKPSDIGGLIYIPFNEHVREITHQLYKELSEAGLRVTPA